MKIKFGSLLAMLLCGASFVTHAGPIPTYTNNYSGEYNCVLTGSLDCTQTATAWRLGYDIQDENQQAARWRFELVDLTTSPLQSMVYESGPDSQLFLGTDDGVGITMFTPPTGDVLFHAIGVRGGIAWVGDWRIDPMTWEEIEGAGVPSFFSNSYLGFSLVTVMQALGQIPDPAQPGLATVSGSRLYVNMVEEVPEPTVLALLGIGLAAFGVSRRRLRG